MSPAWGSIGVGVRRVCLFDRTTVSLKVNGRSEGFFTHVAKNLACGTPEVRRNFRLTTKRNR
jgi:hypothetical protein